MGDVEQVPVLARCRCALACMPVHCALRLHAAGALYITAA